METASSHLTGAPNGLLILSRRMNQPHSSGPFRVGDWRVDPAFGRISNDATEIKLEPRTMRLLVFLAERAGQLVTLEEMLESVWADVVVTPASAYQAIGQLRRQLGDTGDESRYIANVPRRGYSLIAPVEKAGLETPATEMPRRSWRWLALGLLVVAGAAFWLLPSLLPRSAPAPQAPSIAVLPFVDMSQDRSQEAFCDGLTEELLISLSRVEQLKVVARTSAFSFRGRAEDVREIGRKLGVSHILEGSVRRTGDRVRITAQLVNSADGFHQWSDTFDRPFTDIIQVQGEIARAVVSALRIELSNDSTRDLVRGPPTRVAAYEAYLLGRHYQHQRTPESLARAIEHYEAAIRLDSSYAPAYAGLADANMGSYFYANWNLNDAVERARPLIAKALELDPQSAESYAVLGVLETETQELESAERNLRRAVALNNNYADAYVRLGATLEYDGRPREALASFTRAAELDPLHFNLHTRRCLALQNLGLYAEATQACQRAKDLRPELPNAHWATGLIALSRGDHVGAIAGYEEALARAPNRSDLLLQLAWLYRDLGMQEEARARGALAVKIWEGSPWPALENKLLFFAEEPAALRTQLRKLELGPTVGHDIALLAAVLHVIAGDPAEARRMVHHVEGNPMFSHQTLYDVWRVRWARPELIMLALARSRSDPAKSVQYARDLEQYLDRLEANGQVWHGIHYLRCDLHALRGDEAAALVSLDKAVELGWRSSWWARIDPALALLRNSGHFVQTLQRVDQSNARLRAQLEAGRRK